MAVLANMTEVGLDMAVAVVDTVARVDIPYFFDPLRMSVGKTNFKVNQRRYNHAHTHKRK